MGVSLTFILVYFIGGLTLLPILLLLIFLHAYLTFPEQFSLTDLDEHGHRHLPLLDDVDGIRSDSSSAILAEKLQRRHEPDVAAGYFAVCREYVPGGINGRPPERTTPTGTIVPTQSPSVYQSMYRSIFDRRQGPTLDANKGSGRAVKRTRNTFYVVLRHGHLMLYEDSEQLEVKHVISLEFHDVSIYAGEDVESIPEGELWIKRNAIKLERKRGLSNPVPSSKPFYLFSENCSEKEDFYFALLQNQESNSQYSKPDTPRTPPKPELYEGKHMEMLVQQLHSSEEHLQTRWINALIGRLFLALYRTEDCEDFVRKKITKKISRVKKPTFLSNIILHRVTLGESAPQITNPRLKDLTLDGDCCVEADFKYRGNFRLEIATTAKIDLGTRFKPREVSLLLAVVVKKLNGHGLVKFKPPPSNRLWMSFETMPDVEMIIEPIVSSRQITYGFILRAIEGRIREVIAETIVLPNWDDIPFTDSTHHQFRGGIWESHSGKGPSSSKRTEIPDEALQAEADVISNRETTPQLPSPTDEINPRLVSDSVQALPRPRRESLSDEERLSLTPKVGDNMNESIVAGLEKTPELPKAFRSRSFASVANPLLSTDNANIDAVNSGKKEQDATTVMMAISNRSRQNSPNDESTFEESEGQTPPSERRQRSLSKSSAFPETTSQLRPLTDQYLPSKSSESLSHLSPSSSPRSTSSLSVNLASNNEKSLTDPKGVDNSVIKAPVKRETLAALGAATMAAKGWGWGILNRNGYPKNRHEGNPHGSSRNPIGRGQPLPPPGQPLPLPGGLRSFTAPAATLKRKPVPTSSLPQGRHGDTKTATTIISGRRRQTSMDPEASVDGELLVVKAPPESAPASPVENQLADSSSPDNPANDINPNKDVQNLEKVGERPILSLDEDDENAPCI